MESEQSIEEPIRLQLNAMGYQNEVAEDGVTGLEKAVRDIYDLAIVDEELPQMSGLDVVRQLRSRRVGVPILMLTGGSSDKVSARIDALKAGADYCLSKPVDGNELSSVVQALIRREKDQVDVLRFGNTELDLNSVCLRAQGTRERLSQKEFDVMRLLMRAGANNISKEAILNRVWGYESDAVQNNVEAYIVFLRKKLRRIGSDVKIVAVRMVGYHLEVMDEAPKPQEVPAKSPDRRRRKNRIAQGASEATEKQ